MMFRQWLEVKKFELIPGITSIKKGPDFQFEGVYLVTLANGQVHPIYFDKQSSFWHHANPKGKNHFDSFLGSTREDALARLVKDYQNYNPIT